MNDDRTGLSMQLRKMRQHLLTLLALVMLTDGCVSPTETADVLAGRNDDARTGANLQETVLTPQLLQAGRFGKLFEYEVSGFVYAQPLIVSGLSTQYGKRNVLLVATTKNKLYAFDADHGVPNIIWQADLTDPGSTLTDTNWQRTHLAPSVGILSTPVIDRETDSVYAIARSCRTQLVLPDRLGKVACGQKLHQVALSTGVSKKSVDIDAGIEVNGKPFNPDTQINRPGLALVNGLVITMWGTFLDGTVERGWVIAFDKSNLSLRGVFCTTCYATNGTGGMIWQSGRPPAVEAGRFLYFFTGNGYRSEKDRGKNNYLYACDPNQHPVKPSGQFAESLVKLDTQQVGVWKDNQGVSSWTPYDWCELDQNDTDLGSSGPMLIPGGTLGVPPIAIGGGKAGVLYAIDTAMIRGPDLVEWASFPKLISGRAKKRGAINECVDFEDNIPACHGLPPYTCFLVGTHMDFPDKFARPWAVNVCPTVGGEHGTDTSSPACVRPLCAPLDPVNYGVKHDHAQHHIMGGPVFLPVWRSRSFPVTQAGGTGHYEAGTGTLYVAPENLPVLAFEVHGGRIKYGPVISQIDQKRFPFANLFITSGHPGGILALSAGDQAGSAIVWASHYHDYGKGNNATFEIQEGVLEAFDAENLNMVWSSEAKPDDRVGYFQKFTPPTIANGKVYVAASPSPASVRGCVAASDPDPCLTYDHAGSDGHIVVYGRLPRRWPWQRRSDAGK